MQTVLKSYNGFHGILVKHRPTPFDSLLVEVIKGEWPITKLPEWELFQCVYVHCRDMLLKQLRDVIILRREYDHFTPSSYVRDLITILKRLVHGCHSKTLTRGTIVSFGEIILEGPSFKDSVGRLRDASAKIDLPKSLYNIRSDLDIANWYRYMNAYLGYRNVPNKRRLKIRDDRRNFEDQVIQKLKLRKDSLNDTHPCP